MQESILAEYICISRQIPVLNAKKGMPLPDREQQAGDLDGFVVSVK
jgi:hypothetical protein